MHVNSPGKGKELSSNTKRGKRAQGKGGKLSRHTAVAVVLARANSAVGGSAKKPPHWYTTAKGRRYTGEVTEHQNSATHGCTALDSPVYVCVRNARV